MCLILLLFVSESHNENFKWYFYFFKFTSVPLNWKAKRDLRAIFKNKNLFKVYEINTQTENGWVNTSHFELLWKKMFQKQIFDAFFSELSYFTFGFCVNFKTGKIVSVFKMRRNIIWSNIFSNNFDRFLWKY